MPMELAAAPIFLFCDLILRQGLGVINFMIRFGIIFRFGQNFRDGEHTDQHPMAGSIRPSLLLTKQERAALIESTPIVVMNKPRQVTIVAKNAVIRHTGNNRQSEHRQRKIFRRAKTGDLCDQRSQKQQKTH